MALIYEAGYWGKIKSLGGLISRENSPRNMLPQGIIITGSANLPILLANSRRISAIIKNQSGDPCLILFSNTSSQLTLNEGDSIQIDESFPWTGDIEGYSTGTSNLAVMEISIE